MVVGVGVDAVPLQRMRLALARTPRLADRVFTPREREAAAARGCRVASLAARFAAKEACRKALGAVIPWQDMEVVTGAGGRPLLRVAGREDVRLHLSMSHTAEVAVAVVVAEAR